jgi:hypothetical protein
MKYILPFIDCLVWSSFTLAQNLSSKVQESLAQHISKNKSAGISGGYATSNTDEPLTARKGQSLLL